jgi:hypothetical protein
MTVPTKELRSTLIGTPHALAYAWG